MTTFPLDNKVFRRSAWLLASVLVGCGVSITSGDAGPAADAGADVAAPSDGPAVDGPAVDGTVPDGGGPPDADAGDTGPGADDAATDASNDATSPDAAPDAATPPDAALPSGTTTCSRLFVNSTGSATGVAVDALGNIVITGTFNASIDFGGGPLVAPSEYPNLFVAKLDASCNHVWSRGFGSGTAAQQATSVALDPLGNVLVTGSVGGAVDFGGGALPNAGGRAAFLLKLDAAGAHVWSHTFGGGEGLSVATDTAGSVALTGYANGSIDFGGGPLVGSAVQGLVMAKLDSAGAHLWSERFGVAGGYGAGIATDTTGMIYAVGAFSNGTLSLGGAPHTNPGGNVDALLAKRDALGAHAFSRSFRDVPGRDLVEILSGVATMPSGDIAVSGRFMGTTDFGGGPLAVVGFSDTVVARYAADGTHVWSTRFGTSSETHPAGIAVDPTNHVIVTGTLLGAADFGGGALTTAGGTDAFLVKLDPNGAHVWSRRFGDAANQAGRAVATDASGNIVMVGRNQGTTDFGLGPRAGSGVFVTKLSP